MASSMVSEQSAVVLTEKDSKPVGDVLTDDELVGSSASEQSTVIQTDSESVGSLLSEQSGGEYKSVPAASMSKIPMSLIGTRVRFMTLKKANLDNHEPGSIATIITEKPILLLNQISSQNSRNRRKHQLENGDQVRICTRPVKDSVLGDNLIGIHFNEQVWSTCNSSDCRCGNCGNYFEILPDPPAKCECGTDPYDPGEQQCTIM